MADTTMLKFYIYALIAYQKSKNREYKNVSSIVIYAQAVHETNNFKSDIFNENKNMFGLKFPQVRETKASGVNRGHSTFKSYVECVQDYFLRQNYFEVSGTNDQEFINSTLLSGYATDPGYQTAWNRLINDLNFSGFLSKISMIKELFFLGFSIVAAFLIIYRKKLL